MTVEITVVVDEDFEEGDESFVVSLVDLVDLRNSEDIDSRPWTEVRIADDPFRTVNVTIVEGGNPYHTESYRVDNAGSSSRVATAPRYAPWSVPVKI